MLLPTPDVIKYAIELGFSVITSLGGRSFWTVVIIYVFFGNFLPGWVCFSLFHFVINGGVSNFIEDDVIVNVTLVSTRIYIK